MRKTTYAGFILALTFFYSCDDNTDEIVAQQTAIEQEHLPLKIGNYWIYKNTTTTNSLVSTRDNDTVRVTKDTLIGEHTYTVIEGDKFFGNTAIKQYLRDSSGYLITSSGIKMFSTTNFTDTLHSNINIQDQGDGKINITHYKMEEPSDPITVTAGTFNTLNFKGYTDDQPNSNTYSCENTHYAKNIGKVKQTWCYSSYPESSLIEKELIEYFVQ